MPMIERDAVAARSLSLQVLSPVMIRTDPAVLREALRALDPVLATAAVEIDSKTIAKGTPFGLVRWGRHVVRIVGFDVPMPQTTVETCVAPAHYSQELKRRARAHQAHALLYHEGDEPSPRERYTALAAVALALASPGSFLLNEAAHSSLPMDGLASPPAGIDRLEWLRMLPLPLLYAGFVKYEVEGIRGVWMRTFGNPLLGIPDLSLHADGHHRGQWVFDLFNDVMKYVLNSGAELEAGHTIEVGSGDVFRLRAPRAGEEFLASAGPLFVAEPIAARDANA
jgi:hypothetical protein